MKNKVVLTKDQLQVLLERHNITIKKSYKHEDYMFTSFTMPYPYKNKLDRLSKKFGLTRSATFRLLLDMIED